MKFQILATVAALFIGQAIASPASTSTSTTTATATSTSTATSTATSATSTSTVTDATTVTEDESAASFVAPLANVAAIAAAVALYAAL